MAKRSMAFGLLLMMAMTLNACAGPFGIGGTSWQEEVLLHDGSKIIAERSITRSGRHEIGQMSNPSNQTLTFTMPGTNRTIQWEDKNSDDIGTSNFNLLLLDIVKGAVYMVASPMGCLSYNKWGRPNPPYVAFKYQGKEWQRITLQELPAMLTTPNLVVNSPDTVAKQAGHDLITADTIKSLNNSIIHPENKTILRKEIPNAGGSCPEMVYYKGMWVGPGDSIGKRMMDRRAK
jgi:hypothetical protein